ncbi:unnamed protein product [Vicia faba]|uniref:Uncharacterized protein n=1 Tax=Vicia faba TaxID=3906 RepID=A0AAV0YXU8_VICFA|nr:unnamed protein product [Vicia faba]
MQNQKSIAQVVEEGIMLSACFQGSAPSLNRHDFRINIRSSQIDSLGTNLMSKFSTYSDFLPNENAQTSTVDATQHRLGDPRKNILEVGSSSYKTIYLCERLIPELQPIPN